MGKTFEKQIRTIENQWERQIDVLKNLKQTKATTYKSDDDNDDQTSISKEIYNEILEERTDKILKMSK